MEKLLKKLQHNQSKIVAIIDNQQKGIEYLLQEIEDLKEKLKNQ